MPGRVASLRLPRGRHLAFAVIAFLYPISAHSDSITISPSRDNTLFEDPAGALSSGAGPGLFAGNNSGSNTRRAVIYFAVAGHIPAGATIDSVALSLYVSSAPNDTPQLFGVHRMLSDWGEGASSSVGGAGAAAEPGDATWLHTFYPDQFWGSPGGDFHPAATADALVGGPGSYTWSSPALITDVQLWIDGLAPDWGWIVIGNETVAATVRRFDSRENGTVENRPGLFVKFTPPTVPVVNWV